MSLTDNRTHQLWSSFMPRRKEIKNNINADFISMQVYSPDYFINFNPHKEFEKWATIEVTDLDHIPSQMQSFTLSEGLYAIFKHIGSSADNSIFQYIFKNWIPNSEYKLDNRPHFELLGEKYVNNNPSSEEEIWIPIIKK